MTEVLIEGRMGSLLGKHHKFSCTKLGEIFSALEANTGKLRRYFLLNKKRYFSVFVNGKAIDQNFFSNTNVKDAKVVILPILMGAVIGTAIAAGLGMTVAAGSAAAAAGAAVGSLTLAGKIVAGIVNAIVAFGISLAVSKLLAPDSPELTNTSSFAFGTPENIAKQGGPVPIGYGRLLIGSRVISSNLMNVDRARFDSKNFYDIFSDNQQIDASNNIESLDGGSAEKEIKD